MKNLSHRFLRAAARLPVDMTPVWLMRQAGRYLPEYREIRAKAGSFLTLCKTPELACEVTLQPLRRFPLDAAILFSDILTIPDAMGLGLYFKEGEGPAFERPVQNEKSIHALSIPDPDMSLGYVLDTIKLVTHELNDKIPLIGFCGSPWTLATYMVEGKANKEFPTIKKMLIESPSLLHELLDILAKSVSLHLNAQIKAGVQAVMIFDTWGGMLATEEYQNFSLNYIKKIIQTIKTAPIIVFTKNSHKWLELIVDTGCQVIGLDWMTNIKSARERIGHHVALQGNMDPAILLTSPQKVEEEVARILADYGDSPGHIFNLGHGVLPATPYENVAALVEAVHRFSKRDSSL